MGRNDKRDDEPDTTSDPFLARLSHNQRIALLLRDRSGLSDQAIAAHLRIEVTEVPRLIQEARSELRRLRHMQTREDTP